MRIKGSLLILLTVSLGTALAMTAKEQKEDSSDVVGAVTKESRAQGVAGSTEQDAGGHFDLSTLKRPMPKSIRGSALFVSKSWYIAPPAPAAPVYISPTVSVPTAPSLPFTFIGRLVDGNEVTLFLSKNDHQYTVKEKDVLDETYRVDKIDEAEAVLTHLPTNTQQTLSFNTTPASNALISTSELKATMLPPQRAPAD